MITKDTSEQEILKMAHPCNCSKCKHGCTMGSGFLAKGDLKKLSEFLFITEEKVKEKYLEEIELFNKKLLRPRFPKPFGKCIFFDSEKGCTVHDPESIRQFNLYLKNGGKTIPGGELKDLVKADVLKKILSYEILR